MKAFLLIFAAILLPFAAIGSMTAASILRVRDGANAGILPDALTALGCVLLVGLAVCIYKLHRMYLAKRAQPRDVEN